MSEYPKHCTCCNGNKFVREKVMDRRGDSGSGIPNEILAPCPQCDAKGFVTEEDNKRYLRNLGIETDPPSQPIYGKIELENGLITSWLMFVDGKLARHEAETEAIRIKSAWWKGVTVRCWCEPAPC